MFNVSQYIFTCVVYYDTGPWPLSLTLTLFDIFDWSTDCKIIYTKRTIIRAWKFFNVLRTPETSDGRHQYGVAKNQNRLIHCQTIRFLEVEWRTHHDWFEVIKWGRSDIHDVGSTSLKSSPIPSSVFGTRAVYEQQRGILVYDTYGNTRPRMNKVISRVIFEIKRNKLILKFN